MCESKAYLFESGRENLVLESVDLLEEKPEGVRIVNLFGEERLLKARVKTLSLVDHKIILEPLS
ncbi:CooT family nickel-binding protein [Desulfatiglans anilini]|uniref:CooT family nickel-binding protein n=1 Tax=Desulfatiglans anilini TaxID=90728 RepID=UPI000403D5A6|nr:CooT family nickel-binding protein [Desulfatiglans anilini]